MALPPVGSKTVTNTANGSFSDAVKGDTSTTKASTKAPEEAASSDGSIRAGTGDFFGDQAKKVEISDDLFE
jgi:hypothetical protein